MARRKLAGLPVALLVVAMLLPLAGPLLIANNNDQSKAHLALQQTDALNRALAALRELHSVVKLMEHADETKRPTDSDVDAALLQAERELGRH